ncbi:helix-turn-helix domain-containing protein [Roseibium sp. Sym1]|uniref:helix-turn-helix domain-containing protein n=1 Tax=Roseibium sp. Sym1 TaxID=3016006 RepID=UPI003FA6DDBE
MKRIMLGMSQEKLGEHLGITFQQIQKYEKGTNRIGSGRLFDIANAFGVEPGFFFEGLTSSGDVSVADQTIMDAANVPGALDLLRSFERLGPKCRQALLQSAKGMIEATA